MLLRRPLVEPGQGDEQRRGDDRHDADPEMEHEGDGRKTGVQGASKIAAIAGLAIAVRTVSKSRIALAATAGIGRPSSAQNARGEEGVEPLACADQQPGADHVEQRQRQQRKRQRQGDEQQSGLAAVGTTRS